MTPRLWLWIAVTTVAFGFFVATYRIARRVRRVRAELRRMQWNRQLAHAYELEQVADEAVWGV
jgi:heme/copper-type cytochrome/quinol oxidase subunit 3